MTKLTTLIVGSHFTPPAKLVLAALSAGSRIALVPEPDNPYDSDAIKAFGTRSDIETSALDEEALAGMGFTMEEVIGSAEPICLGHVASSQGKPLAKAQSAVGAHVVGTEEIHARAASRLDPWPIEGKLVFGPGGEALVEVEI